MPPAKRLERQVDGGGISVIVPTLNEQAQLHATLSQVYLGDGDEL